jgi:hypothetical protein
VAAEPQIAKATIIKEPAIALNVILTSSAQVLATIGCILNPSLIKLTIYAHSRPGLNCFTHDAGNPDCGRQPKLWLGCSLKIRRVLLCLLSQK